MKCEICQANIQTTFLKKIVGTVVKDTKGKKHYVCSTCQKLGKAQIIEKV